MSSSLKDLMCPKSAEEAAEVMFRTNPSKYWRQYINVIVDEIESLEKQLAEKEAMIDWLVSQLQIRCNCRNICGECIENIEKYKLFFCHNNNWRKAAQEAVKNE